jgi:hypothetical protein
MNNIWDNPNITDIVYDGNSKLFLCSSNDGNGGQVFSLQNIISYSPTTCLDVPNTQLMTIAMVYDTPIVSGAGGYSARGVYTTSYPYYTFTELQTGVTNDINDMVWTATFIGAIVCGEGVVGLNRFSGGASNVLKYKPIPLANTLSPGIVQPDMASITIDSNGIISTVGGGGGGSDSWVPSDQYITITYGASGDMYTSPGDGWIYAKCTTQNTNAYITSEAILTEGTNIGIYGAGQTTYSSGRSLYLLFPVATGYKFKMFNSNLMVNIFRFIYSKGAL